MNNDDNTPSSASTFCFGELHLTLLNQEIDSCIDHERSELFYHGLLSEQYREATGKTETAVKRAMDIAKLYGISPASLHVTPSLISGIRFQWENHVAGFPLAAPGVPTIIRRGTSFPSAVHSSGKRVEVPLSISSPSPIPLEDEEEDITLSSPPKPSSFRKRKGALFVSIHQAKDFPLNKTTNNGQKKKKKVESSSSSSAPQRPWRVTPEMSISSGSETEIFETPPPPPPAPVSSPRNEERFLHGNSGFFFF